MRSRSKRPRTSNTGSKSADLFIVADGMGGHAVGEKASTKAVQEIPLTYVKHVHDGPAAALRHAFQEANAGINAIGSCQPGIPGSRHHGDGPGRS